jgi:DNA helicase-2/ATP-dependent DNA helicase PcrA
LLLAEPAGRFGASAPYAVEAPFSLLVGGRLVRGRIDAVYALPDAGPGEPRWRVVDWKTSRADAADPLQLAIYRLAWAEVQQVPVEEVDAGFYHVRSDRYARPERLLDRAEIEALLAGPA